MAERWTPLVLRAFFCGATRYNDIQASVPRMSSALLSRRLKELEYANIIHRQPASSGRGHEYHLTEAGTQLWPVLDQMGVWAQTWLRREITSDKNLDPDEFMWEVRRSILGQNIELKSRKVVNFKINGVPVAKRFYWLVIEPDDVEVCMKDPGYEVDLWITATMRTFVELWLGHRTIPAALNDESLQLDGSPSEIATFRDWFILSPLGRRELA